MTTKSAVKQAAEAHDKVTRMDEAFNEKTAKLYGEVTLKQKALIDALPPDVRAVYDRIAASGAEE